MAKASPLLKDLTPEKSLEFDPVRELEEVACELGAPLEPQGIMNALVKRVVERYRVEFAGVWQWNEGDSTVELRALAGSPEVPPTLKKTRPEQTLLGKAAQDQLPQVYPASNGDELALWANEHRLAFLAVYPLVHDANVHGLLLVACARTPPDPLLTLFRLHTRLAALALRDAELLLSTQRTLAKLSFLVEASKALGSTLDLGELLGRILEVAKTQVDAERGTLFMVDEKKEEIWSLIAHGLEKREIRLPLGRGIAGHVARTGEIVNIPDAYADSRFDAEVDKRTGYRTRNILCLPIRNKAGKILAVLQLLNKQLGVFTADDTDFLLALSGHIALALENAQLHRDLLEKERLDKEMALARGIQRSLLPETTPSVQGFDIALLNEPCYEVGGDYYDFLSLGPNTLLVVIADVEGKGISSALIMSNLQATLRSLILQLHSLNDIAESLNQMILAGTRREKYLSLFLGLIDLRRKSFHYINCGHVPPILVRPDQTVAHLTEGGLVIGLFENVQYERGQVKFSPGDVLILCTDGITESMDAHHDEYGEERLIDCVRHAAMGTAGDIVRAVQSDVTRHSREGTHMDDKVMIAIKVV